jgi:SsrA-binding protein
MAQKKAKAAHEAIVNRKARREYEILEDLEAGIALVGTEVKSLRSGQVSLNEAYIKARKDGLWLEQAHFAEYTEGNMHNHDPLRPRRLLVHRAEQLRLLQKSKEKGLTLIPLKVYFKGRWAKVELGLGKGRKLHDKRQVVKEREASRDIRRHLGKG